MKKEKLVYHLCYYSHVTFYYLFWSYFIILIIIHFLGIELNTYLGYLFFLLLGSWLGSSTALTATRYMKKIYQKEQYLDKKKKE